MSEQACNCPSLCMCGVVLPEDAHRGQIAEMGREIRRFKAEAEALRAENGRLRDQYDRDVYGLNNEGDPIGGDPAGGYANDNAKLRTELEAARGLLEQRIPCDVMLPPATTIKRGCPLSTVLTSMKMREDVPPNQRVFHPAPEVQAEQGERQEAVAIHQWEFGTSWVDGSEQEIAIARADGCHTRTLYTTPQPGPDVRGLAAFALDLIEGAWNGGSFDGGDIQEAGVRHGLLVVEQREESCGEHCDCAEYGFPSECYRLTPALAAHRQAQRKA